MNPLCCLDSLCKDCRSEVALLNTLQVHAAPAACLGCAAVRSDEQVLAADVCALAEGDVQSSEPGVRSKRLWHEAAGASSSLVLAILRLSQCPRRACWEGRKKGMSHRIAAWEA